MATGITERRDVVPPLARTIQGRVFWQPRKWTFWAYVGLVIASTVPWFGIAFYPAGALPWGVTAVSVAATAALGVLLVLLIRSLDVHRGIPAPLLVAAFVWGALVATGWAVVANDQVFGVASKVLGAATGARWEASISAPVVEESLKAIGTATVLLIGREFVRRPAHGMFIGAFCGLGFQLVEDVLYAVQSAFSPDASSDAAAVAPVIGGRTLTALDSHWLYSAVTGLALGYALTRRDRSWPRRLLVAAALFLVAWWMHFLSDSPIPGGALGIVTKTVLNLLLGFVVYRIAMRAEWRHYAATVDGEPDEIISRAEVESMRTHRGRRRVRKRYRRHGGKPAKRAARQLQRAQLELANDLETDPAAAARTRAAILNLRSRLPGARAD
ncbi:MAG TPA: PrsW family intramembrane metalloprotease [Natronosporangium sp.]